MEQTVKELLFEAFKAAQQITDRTKKKRLTDDLRSTINLVFKDKQMRIDMRNILKGIDTSKPVDKKKSALKGYSDFEEYVPGKDQPSQLSKTSIPKNAVTVNKDKPKQAKRPIVNDDNIIDIIKLDNQGIIDHFGGIGAVKKFAKIQAFEINYRLKGDEYLNPFREALMKLAGIEHDSELLGKDNDIPPSDEEE